jgi:hypothetical protein
MSFTSLQRGDKGEQVIRLQTELNKVGAMLTPDGDFGRGTEVGVRYAQDVAQQPLTGIADTALWQWLALQPPPFDRLDTNGVAFIAKEETGGLAYYDMVTRWPHYPGHASGITIGVGYDLRFNTHADFVATWGSYLPGDAVAALSKDIGVKGSKARADELKSMGLSVPFKSAWPVFVGLTLPRFYAETATIYPSIPRLSGLCASALVSLVFNRGASLSGASRREMRQIQAILQRADNAALTAMEKSAILAEVEDQILSMKRLWSNGSGLIKRRQSEANLWRQGLALT